MPAMIEVNRWRFSKLISEKKALKWGRGGMGNTFLCSLAGVESSFLPPPSCLLLLINSFFPFSTLSPFLASPSLFLSLGIPFFSEEGEMQIFVNRPPFPPFLSLQGKKF